MRNWKTTLTGIAVLILVAAGSVLQEYYPLRGLNWSVLFNSIALATGGTGLMAAKDGTNHSTQAEVQQATVIDNVQKSEAAAVAAAAAESAAAKSGRS